MFEMASSSSPSLGYVLKDHNCPDHTSLDSNRRLPPTYSSKSHSQTPSKPRKSNLKEPTNENHLVDERKTSSYKVSNQRRNCISCHNNHDDVPPPSPLMSRRQARVLDQWAAQQARETITTIERQKHSEFDISSISDSNYVSFRSRPSSRETSPSPSDSSVSSLVQKWREFEISDVKQPPNNPTPPYHNEGGNSGACSILVSRANSISSSIEPSEQENDSLNNWEHEQTYTIDNYNNTCDINGGHKDVEKDKIRVMDIIKKLPLVECEKANTVCSPVVLSSPRIRGRQAVAALFAKQERDRYSEIDATSKRQAVSKFPKRGPLQTMLKLRALRREVSSQDQSIQQSSRVYEINKLKLKSHASSSSINNIRKKFNSALSECDDSLKTIHTAQDDKLTTTNSAMEESLTSNKPLQTTKIINNKSDQEEKSSAKFDKLTSNHNKTDQVEIITIKASLKSKNQEKEKEEEGNMEKMDNMSSSEDLVPQITKLQDVDEKEDVQPKMILSSNIIWSKTRNCDELVNCIPLETNNVSSYVGWEDHRICEEEEQEGGYDDYDLCGPYLDWINEVSKPRSYWESLRKAWYAEIFTSSSKNEIRQLIERGSVSNVLASDFPEKMDRIMTSSYTRRQAKSGGYDREDESRLQVAFTQNKTKPLSIHLEEEKHDHQDLQEHHFIVEEAIKNVKERIEGLEQEVARENDVRGNEDVEEEPESLSSNQYNNGGFYNEQAQVSSSLVPWTNYDNQEESDNSEQFEPTPHQEQSSITNSFDQDTQGGSSSCKNNSSIEMELIYDFRAHMEQMYREITELRMSVNSCVDMQAKLQNSIRDEVFAILSHSGSKKTKGKESNCKAHEKGCCCICYEKKVDSVLYRCGHMCACFKCAHELQWSSGKCPVCRAQIVDVVRVYTEDA